MDRNALANLARYQSWADAEHWKALHANPALLEDAEIRKRLNHMLGAFEFLRQAAANGEIPDPALTSKERENAEELERAMTESNRNMVSMLETIDLGRKVSFPRGPKGPFQAPAGDVVMQALMHSQHHRAQNASRMRQLEINPPMTDYILWYGTNNA